MCRAIRDIGSLTNVPCGTFVGFDHAGHLRSKSEGSSKGIKRAFAVFPNVRFERRWDLVPLLLHQGTLSWQSVPCGTLVKRSTKSRNRERKLCVSHELFPTFQALEMTQ